MKRTDKISRENFITAVDSKMEELGYGKGKRKVLHRFQVNKEKFRIVLEKRQFPCGFSVRMTTEKRVKEEWVKIHCTVNYH
jgi:hypothetical protein